MEKVARNATLLICCPQEQVSRYFLAVVFNFSTLPFSVRAMTKPSFDAWTTVFSVAAVQAFFVAFVLWRWPRGRSEASRLLAVLLLLFGVTLTEYVLWWSGYLLDFPHVANVSAQFPYLFGPLLFLYFRTIYTSEKLARRDLWHLAPFVVAMLAFAPFYGMDADAKRAQILGEMDMPVHFWVLRGLLWARIAHLFGYAAWNFRFIQEQPRVAATRAWAHRLNTFFLVFALAYLSYFVLVRFAFFNTAWDYHISAVMTAMIYLIAYAGYVQPAVFEGFTWAEPTAAAKYRNSGLTPAASQSLAQRLSELMCEEQLFRESELRLDDLAARLEVGKHHVSQVINEHLGVSFFEYVNGLRVTEAQRLLAATGKNDMNVIEVAYAVGFNNKASFNTAFKKTVGMTPTEFRRKMQAPPADEPMPDESRRPGALNEG